MAFVSCVEIPEARSASFALGDQRIEHQYTRKFLVKMGALADGPKAAIAGFHTTTSIDIGTSYSTGTESDSFAFCRSAVANYVDPFYFEITVEYGQLDPRINNLTPTSDLPKVSVEFAQFEEIVDIDINGNPVVNSAGDAFDPPVTRDQSRPVITIVRNEATFSLSLAYSYKDTVNSATWFGCAAHTVKCSNIQATREWDPNSGLYWAITYQFAVEPNGWKRKIADAGFRKLITGTPNKFENIKDDKGQQITAPAFLDGSGQPLAPPVSSSSVNVLTFEIYPEVDFNTAFSFDSTMLT